MSTMKRRCPRCKRKAELTGRMRIKVRRWWFPPLTFKVCDGCTAEMMERAKDLPGSLPP
jgi:hypothetical protein